MTRRLVVATVMSRASRSWRASAATVDPESRAIVSPGRICCTAHRAMPRLASKASWSRWCTGSSDGAWTAMAPPKVRARRPSACSLAKSLRMVDGLTANLAESSSTLVRPVVVARRTISSWRLRELLTTSCAFRAP